MQGAKSDRKRAVKVGHSAKTTQSEGKNGRKKEGRKEKRKGNEKM